MKELTRLPARRCSLATPDVNDGVIEVLTPNCQRPNPRIAVLGAGRGWRRDHSIGHSCASASRSRQPYHTSSSDTTFTTRPPSRSKNWQAGLRASA